MKVKLPFVLNLVFLALLLIISWFYSYHDILFNGPYSSHLWRQTDCLATAYSFFIGNKNLLNPSSLYRYLGGANYSLTEFPIIYYLVSLLWQTFGHGEITYRILMVLLLYWGLFKLHQLSGLILNDPFWASFVALMLFCSPVVVFYGNNFLPNVPSLSLVLAGWFYYFMYYKKKTPNYLIFSIVLFSLASLVKISAFVNYLAVILIFIIEHRKNFNLKHLAIVSSGIIPVAGWNYYVINYLNPGVSGSISPIWSLKWEKILEIFVAFNENLLPAFFNLITISLTLLLFCFLLYRYKKSSAIVLITVTLLFLGSLFDLLIWYDRLNVHDYYLINAGIIVPAVILVFLNYLRNNLFRFFKSYIIKSAALLLLLYNIYYCAVMTRIRYNATDSLVQKSFIPNKPLIAHWQWYHWNYGKTYAAFETITPHLRDWGINPLDTVISISDDSPNITLYFMKQRGFTHFGFQNDRAKEQIQQFIEAGAKYLIVNRKREEERGGTDLSIFFEKLIGSHQYIDVYDLRGFKDNEKNVL